MYDFFKPHRSSTVDLPDYFIYNVKTNVFKQIKRTVKQFKLINKLIKIFAYIDTLLIREMDKETDDNCENSSYLFLTLLTRVVHGFGAATRS